jgi:peptidylprolyl isomerase
MLIARGTGPGIERVPTNQPSRSMTAQTGNSVTVHYTGKLEDGTVFDSSRDREPLSFVIGSGQVIPGFEKAVVGLEPGETRTERIEPEDAYGERRDEMIMEVEREHLPPDLNPEAGQQLQIQQSDGQVIPVVVADVSESSITIDANHPLAGQPLIFEIEVVEVV